MNRFKIFLTLLCLAAVTAFSAGSAWALTAANTAITNKATLSYNGGTATAQVTVTVSLVASNPNVTITTGNAAYTAPNTPAITNSVVITSTSNGPTSYTVTPSVTAQSNTKNDASVSGGTTVTIGASVTTGTSGTTYVTVPAPVGVSGNNATVNGIAVNSVITFTVNSHTYTETVTGTTDNGDGTYRLNWTGAIPAADVPGAGVLVAGQYTVNLSVLPGTVNTTGTNITVTVQGAVATTGAGTVNVSNAAPGNSWTTPNPNVVFTKYVRNVTHPVAGSGDTSFTVNGTSSHFYTGNVTGTTGDYLEYVVVAVNNGPDLTGCAISDVIPTAYAAFQPSVYGGGGMDVFYIDTTGATFKLTAGAVGANQASYVAPNLAVNVGVGANATTTGTIPGTKSVAIAYQVKIN